MKYTPMLKLDDQEFAEEFGCDAGELVDANIYDLAQAIADLWIASPKVRWMDGMNGEVKEGPLAAVALQRSYLPRRKGERIIIEFLEDVNG